MIDAQTDVPTLKASAQVKVGARMSPAKDIQIAYADILSNIDSEKFEELKKQFLFSIDAADAEYGLLSQELGILQSMIPKWNEEIEQTKLQIENLKTEIGVLEKEKEDVDEKMANYLELSKIKTEASNINIEKITKDIENCTIKNKEDEDNIAAAEISNERRKQAVLEIYKGIQSFKGANSDDQQSAN